MQSSRKDSAISELAYPFVQRDGHNELRTVLLQQEHILKALQVRTRTVGGGVQFC